MIEAYKIVHGYYDSECVPYLQPSLYHNTRGHDRKLFKLNSLATVKILFYCSCCFQLELVAIWCGECIEYQCVQESTWQTLVIGRVSLRLQGQVWKMTPSSVGGLRPVPVYVYYVYVTYTRPGLSDPGPRLRGCQYQDVYTGGNSPLQKQRYWVTENHPMQIIHYCNVILPYDMYGAKVAVNDATLKAKKH